LDCIKFVPNYRENAVAYDCMTPFSMLKNFKLLIYNNLELVVTFRSLRLIRDPRTRLIRPIII